MVRLSPEQERGRHEEGPDRHHRLPDAHCEPRAHADRCPVAVARARAPPPMPSVVEYPHGRYELRGDGVTAPYTWVWIPNPPPPPPPPAPPAGAPPAPPASGSPAPERHSQVYRWTDGQGVTHLTDRWDAVPLEYRARATRFQPS